MIKPAIERARYGNRDHHHRCPDCGEFCWPLRAEVTELRAALERAERERDECREASGWIPLEVVTEREQPKLSMSEVLARANRDDEARLRDSRSRDAYKCLRDEWQREKARAEKAERALAEGFSEREVRLIARVLEPDKYPLPGEDFTDIINEALRAVRRVMDARAALRSEDTSDES